MGSKTQKEYMPLSKLFRDRQAQRQFEKLGQIKNSLAADYESLKLTHATYLSTADRVQVVD